QEIRNEMVRTMTECGIEIETHHHEVATAGQCEIDMRFAPLTHMADQVMLYKYIVKNTAFRHNKTATFMPKPLFNDNGSGMHCHQSLWKNGQPLFAGKEYAGLSKKALHYIAGLIRHAPAITAFTNPALNSFKRLVPGFEAPTYLVHSRRNRSASIRIPMYSTNPKAKRVEYRCPDPTCNPYLAFSAMLMAGLDGIRKKLEPPAPVDENIYHLPREKAAQIKSLPGSLEEALEALRTDHQFLLEGGVFTRDVISTWIDYKYEKEIQPARMRPTPWEYHLYFDA
ncbi:MAG: type I glutamate--ammonia ligase, partial [Candidatus Diapherotrites archaeon]|nr:type I glutamate--ammonia ligase [Candidatus Diapherotrites archaeon]